MYYEEEKSTIVHISHINKFQYISPTKLAGIIALRCIFRSYRDS